MVKKRKKKKKIRIGKLIIFLSLLIILLYFGYKFISSKLVKLVLTDYYLTSDISTIDSYEYDKENKKIVDSDKLIRGTKVSSYDKNIQIDEVNYLEVMLNDKTYYIKESNLTKDENNIVTEKLKYVRTSTTVYKNEKDSKIESFIKKGNEIEITDYDYLLEDGNVNMYKITKGDIEGWIYSKYLVDTEELAKANYNENNTYDTHKNRKYSYELYGGKASTLDYYPYEKPSFENNKLVSPAKTMYLNAGTNVINGIDSYLEIAKNNGVNAIVVDLKDGALAYPLEIAKEYSMTAYKSAINSFDNYKKAIDKIKEAGIYVIGRIVAFNDYHYGIDNQSERIQHTEWVSAYSRKAWEYNVELAKQAIHDMGFNEIQYDYVRFPESSFNYSKWGYDFKNKYNEEKAEAIQNFLFYAADQIHKENVYLSADVFGECSSEYVTAYGQYWPAISNIVDVISSMPYTDHFGRNVDTWTNAYQTVYNWAKGAAKRQTEIPSPAIPRTWITAYDTPHWNPTVVYGEQKIADQAKALVDAGLTGGFITWNSASSIYKYRQIAGAFKKDYS